MMERGQLDQWFHRQLYGIVAKIQAISKDAWDTPSAEVQVIIEQYSQVFVEPRRMPLPRFNDHRFLLRKEHNPLR